jgi:hypothetical protein
MNLALALVAALLPGGGAAPVTAPDTVTTYAGNFVFPEVLANDTDPEGDKLKVCGLEGKHPRIDSDFDKSSLYLEIGERAKPGTYTYTYAACDGTSSTPGAFTLVLVEPPTTTVRNVKGHPGRLRVRTEAPFKVRLTYGDFRREDAEAIVTVPRKGATTFTTQNHRLDWIARTVDGTFLSRGHVKRVP